MSEHYDEQTLSKVYQALEDANLDTDEQRDVVSALQNAGILFRERGKPTPARKIQLVGPEEATEERPIGVYVDDAPLPFLVGSEIRVDTGWPRARSLVHFEVYADEVILPTYVSPGRKEAPGE